MARKCCGNPNLEDDDGVTVCTNCGSVISESQIVAEIQFGETSAGAAVVQGSFVGVTDTHARNTGPFNRKGGGESREVTLAAGRRKIQQLAAALNIPETYTDAASRWFTLALTNGFTHGRKTQNVVACCLYAVCRQEKSSHMLIDFSDILHINVFTLGQTYLKLVRTLCIPVSTIDPSIYIHRFAKHLEFGKDTMKVAADANRLVSRMNRDWIVQGRRPSGICGACLLIAARMNNYRRSVREIVYVVKVADLTIHKRLEEFKRTKSSALTVDEFRNMWLEQAHDPPSFGDQHRKRKRRVREVNENGEVIQDNGQPTPHPQPQPGEEVRRDADGFVIPSVPIDPALLAFDASQVPSYSPCSTAIAVPSDGEAQEDGVATLPNQLTLDDVFDKVADEAIESEINNIVNSTEADSVAAELAEVRRLQRQNSAQSAVSDDPDDLADVDDDWEVKGALLTEEETAIKEQIWTELNKEYLLEQEAKRLKAERDARNGVTKQVRKRRKTGPRNKARDSTSANQAASPAESAKEMLAKRTYSKKINYAALDHLFDND